MNDLEFAQHVSGPVGQLYEEAKRSRRQFPRNTLIAARSLASLCCDILCMDRVPGWPAGLDEKIRALAGARRINGDTRERLDRLRRWGNRAAHPEEGMIDSAGCGDLAVRALEVMRGLLETTFQERHAGAALPRYEVVDDPPDELPDACFRALIGNSAPDQYLVAMTLQEQLAAEIGRAKAEAGAEARLLRLGIDSRRLEERSLDLLRYASDAGHPAARYQYGLALSEGQLGDSKKAYGRNLIAMAGNQGNTDALAWCGRQAMLGLHDEPVDYPYARKCLELAAADDHPMALTLLAEIYRDGLGVTPDPQAAFALAMRAADAGYPSAQYSVALAFLRGEGVGASQDEASKWLRRASDAGVGAAQYIVAKSIEAGEMEGSEEDVERLLKQATRTVNMACLDLVALYMRREDRRQWVDAAVMIQHAYERALGEDDQDVAQRCLAVAPDVIARLEAAHAGMPDGLAKDFLMTRFMFDRERRPYPKRDLRLRRWIDATQELLRVRNTGSPAELKLLRELASGMGGAAARPAISPRPGPRLPFEQRVTRVRIGRNETCLCGSGRKAKKCCARG